MTTYPELKFYNDKFHSMLAESGSPCFDDLFNFPGDPVEPVNKGFNILTTGVGGGGDAIEKFQ